MLSYLNSENKEFFDRVTEYDERDFYSDFLNLLRKEEEYDWQDELEYLNWENSKYDSYM